MEETVGIMGYTTVGRGFIRSEYYPPLLSWGILATFLNWIPALVAPVKSTLLVQRPITCSHTPTSKKPFQAHPRS